MHQICHKVIIGTLRFPKGWTFWSGYYIAYSSENSKWTGTQREKAVARNRRSTLLPHLSFSPGFTGYRSDCCSEIDGKGCGWWDGWLGGNGDTLLSISGSILSDDKDNKQIFRWFIWSVWKRGGGLSGTWTSRNNIFGWRDFSRVLSGSLRESHLDRTVFLL